MASWIKIGEIICLSAFLVTTVVGKIIEQSLIEIMEEDELETLLVQQRAFEERRRIELLRLRRMQLREQKVTEEREHLIAQRQIEVEDEKETEGIVMASFYAENYLGGVAYNSMDELRRFGFMTGNDSGFILTYLIELHKFLQ